MMESKRRTEPREGGGAPPWLVPALALLVLGIAGTVWWKGTRPVMGPDAWDTSRQSAAGKALGKVEQGQAGGRTVSLPSGNQIKVAAGSMEAELLAELESGQKSPNRRFTFDRVRFEGTAVAQPSQEQLVNVANILNAYPNVRGAIGSSGGTTEWRDRAANVRAELMNPLRVSGGRFPLEHINEGEGSVYLRMGRE